MGDVDQLDLGLQYTWFYSTSKLLILVWLQCLNRGSYKFIIWHRFTYTSSDEKEGLKECRRAYNLISLKLIIRFDVKSAWK
jgi:hypothetical protein